MVAGSDPGGQLGDSCVEDVQVIGDRVRAGVARAQHRGECLAGLVGETEQRVEPEPALVGRARPLLVLGVDLDQRRVDVQHHHRGPGRRAHPPPHAGAH